MMLSFKYVVERDLRCLCLMLLLLFIGAPSIAIAQSPLTIARTTVDRDQVDVWLKLPENARAFDPNQLVLTEDGQPQRITRQPTFEHHTSGIALVVRDDATVDETWLLATLRLVLGVLPTDSLVALSSCKHGADVLVSPTLDHNAPFNRYAETSETNVAATPCRASELAEAAVHMLAQHADVQPLGQIDVIVIGGVLDDQLAVLTRRWAIVPETPDLSTQNTPNMLVVADPSAPPHQLQDLTVVLDASRSVLHATYTSRGTPGTHRVGATYGSSGVVETMISIPVLPPRITLLQPRLDQVANTGEIGLGIAIDYEQTPLQSVRYLVNGEEVASAHSPPFAATWRTTLPPGTYSLVAVATDRSHAEAMSPHASITLARPNSRLLLSPWLLRTIFVSAACMLVGMTAYRMITQRKVKSSMAVQDAQLLSLLDVSTGIPMLHVAALTSEGKIIEASFQKTSVRVGSDARWVDFPLADPSIAPIHLTIWHREHGIVIEPHDVVLVDEQPHASSFAIQSGMGVRVGQTMLSVEKRAAIHQAIPIASPSKAYTTLLTSPINETMAEMETKA